MSEQEMNGTQQTQEQPQQQPRQERLFLITEGVLKNLVSHLENTPSPTAPVREVMGLLNALYSLQVVNVVPPKEAETPAPAPVPAPASAEVQPQAVPAPTVVG